MIKYPLSFATGLMICCLSGSNLRAQEAQIQVLGIGSDAEIPAEEMAGGAMFSFSSPGFSIGSPIGIDPSNNSQLFSLLGNESVRSELQLTDEQYGGVQQIMKASQKRLSQLIREKMTQRENGQAIRIGGADFENLMAENQLEAEAALEEILLPEQMKRIRQVAYQVEVSQEGIGESLVTGRLGEEIGVHDDQKQNLLDRAIKIEQEAQAAILEIRRKARAKLFAELTPDQRKAAEALLGDYFEYKEPSLGQQIRKSMKAIERQRTSDSESKSKK